MIIIKVLNDYCIKLSMVGYGQLVVSAHMVLDQYPVTFH